ncbi:CZB domain-containing protein [Sulfurospirillum sp. 1307]
MDRFKINHIVFKSNAYSAVVKGNVSDKLFKDYKNCYFGKWYYGEEVEKFRNNKTFKEMEKYHKDIHDKVNENLTFSKNCGDNISNEDKEKIIKRFSEAEEASNKLFALMDKFVDEVEGT